MRHYSPDVATNQTANVSSSCFHCCGGRCVACNVISIQQQTRLPLQAPWQRIKIDIASGENNPNPLASDIDLALLNRSKGNSC